MKRIFNQHENEEYHYSSKTRTIGLIVLF